MTDQKPFDPNEHTVEEVKAHLATADDAERARVLEAEKAGKDRATLAAENPDDDRVTVPADVPEEKLTAEQKAERAALPADVQTGIARPKSDPVTYKPDAAVAEAQKRASAWATPAKPAGDTEGE